MDTWQTIDRAAPEEAARLLASACGSSRWVERMLRARPFASREAILSAAEAAWQGLTSDDWREAFSHHPKIGDRQRLRERFPSTHALSEHEQAGIEGASEAVMDALADANRRYELRFGYIFIVCATGRSASDMLALLTARLDNDPEHEIQIAAAEQLRITALRLAGSPPPNVPTPP